ncbi:DUF4362 domain-containing protein [Paenibacillus sp. MAH-34]|uniref:DUF4362 domain-containing protein n=1 Tax=Paenibacillus anseongense TaxID=2682845 RepID=A0ABW9UBU2_9BACL|nr:DUF4362 domain-containing protein [Paenibacillus anseongense]
MYSFMGGIKLIKKLIIFAFAMCILSSCSNINGFDQSKGTLKNNADVIDIHGSVSNLFKMDDFVKKVNEKENVSIRISHYTIEGDPIYQNIKYSDGKFELQYDTTQDKFGAGKVTTYSCENFEKTETNTEMKYTLIGCSSDVKNIDVLYLSYDVSKQDLFQFQLKYGDNQANEINTIDMKFVKNLKSGQIISVNDFQLSNEERQKIYKKMVLSNFLSEKKFATCTEKPDFYLKVKINNAVREYNWSDCTSNEDDKLMTDLANTIIKIVNSNQFYVMSNTKMMSKEQALDLGKKLDLDSADKAKWSATLVEKKEYDINNQKEKHTVWVVEAIYPLGNKMIVDFDAYSGNQIIMAEMEANN